MKIQYILSAFLSIVFFSVYAQEKIESSLGPISIHPISHATFAILWNGKTIYVDPTGGAEAFADVGNPDIILITDIHGDHLNIKTLENLETTNTKWIVPQSVADKLPKELAKNLTIVNNGEKTETLSIMIEAIPMYNLPEAADGFHPKGRGNGYVLTMGNKRMYIAGDTEDIPEMRALKNIDVAFVCMNLPYTMDINQAASTVLEFKPKVVYPYHYRGQGGLADVDEFKRLVAKGNSGIEVRLLNWYP